jgi:glycosyltransferase involved in cell wall biosynthesis
MQVIISIIVPIYNSRKYIGRCIDSLINQTYEDIEIILVDDCSTDNSIEIAQEYAAIDKRIKIIKNDKNEGLSFSRNNGMRNSTAPYIMFCDSDDEYKLDMCEKMFNAIKTGADCAVCAAEVVCFDDFSDKNEANSSYFDMDKSEMFLVSKDLISQTQVMPWNKIYRRSIIEKYNVVFPIGLYYEDNSFWFAYGLLCKKIFFIKEKLYIYNRRGGTITSDSFAGKISSHYDDYIKNAAYLYEWLVKNDLYEKNFEFYGWCFKYFVNDFLVRLCAIGYDTKICYDTAYSFIACKKTALTPNELDAIKNRRFHSNDKYYRFMGVPIIKIKKSLHKCGCYLFGVPIYKKKYSENRCRYRILGLIKISKRLQQIPKTT